MSEWRSMDSAPVEQDVLVWDGRTIAVGRRSRYKDGRIGEWFVADSFGLNEDGQIDDVTHWMPLPAPPNA